MSLERTAIIITSLILLILAVNYVRNVLLYHHDCYVPPEMICHWQKCNLDGLNYSRVARHEGASGYDCFCLNGMEEVVR